MLYKQMLDADIRALDLAFSVIRYGADKCIISANSNFARLIGFEIGELIGEDAGRFISNSAGRESQRGLWERLHRGEQVDETALWIGNLDKEVWLRSRYVPVTEQETGQLEAVVQIALDVSAQQMLKAELECQVAVIEKMKAVLHLDLDGIMKSANPLFLSIFGYAEEEIVGRHHSLLIPAGERDDEEHCTLWTDLKAGVHRTGEFRRIAKSGSDIWLQAVYSPIRDPAGRIFKIVQYAVDLTEEKMRRADCQSQIMAIHKSNSVITFDLNGAILEANAHFLSATGYTLQEIEGHHHRMFVAPDYAQSTNYATFWNALRRGECHSGQHCVYGKDGSEIWFQATYNPIFDAIGRPVRVIAYASVVTEERMLQVERQGQIAAINKALCVISFDLDGTILDANENFLDMMGYRFADVHGHHHRMFVTKEELDSESYKVFWTSLAAGHHQSGEFKRVCHDGRAIWLQATYNPIKDMSGRVFRIVKYATDVTPERLRIADNDGQIQAINKSQDVAVYGIDGMTLDVNDNFLRTMGYTRAEIVGKPHALLLNRVEAASVEYAAFWAKLRAGEHQSGLFKRVGKGGKEVWLQASYNPIFDLDGQTAKIVEYASDVSSNVALAQAYEEAKRTSQHDPATSLPNRAKLATFMNSLLVHSLSSMVVFYLDLDRFKPINDTFGHHVGDRVLGEVADRLRRLLRTDQIVARVGGDEFVVASPGMSLESVERFITTLLQIVTAPICHDDGEIMIGLSAGIAIAPGDGSTIDDLLRAADAALYRSKQNGRGRYSYFSSDLNEKIHRQRKLLDDIRNGMVAGEFFLEFQPRFNVKSRTICSAEALIRWNHPERGRISPAEFIPLAEQSGLIVPLGDWVLNAACVAAAAWDGVAVSVNVSPAQFNNPGLLNRIRTALDVSGLSPALLELEITEGVLLEDVDRAASVLRNVKELGVKLAMDDFGAGYSSLSYVRDFPFDVIKIDRSFIQNLEGDGSARPIVQAILGLGKALNISVIAEGVETDEQLALLEQDSCTEVQGFLFAEPMLATDLHKLLLSSAEKVTEIKV